MAIYYVEATGSNEYPFNSRATAAISFYELFDALDENDIYEISTGDIVYVNGEVTEPDESGWYTFNGGSLIGNDSSADIIDISSGCFYADENGIIVRNLAVRTSSADAYAHFYCDGNIDISGCKLDGGNYSSYAISSYGRRSNVSILCNTFENFTDDTIYLYDNGPPDDFVSLGLPNRDYYKLACDQYNNLYASKKVYGRPLVRYTGQADFQEIPGVTQRNWGGAICAYGSDVWACTAKGVYKRTNGTGDFVVVQEPASTEWAFTITGIAVSPFGDVYITNGAVYNPPQGVRYAIWKQTGGVGVFQSLNVLEDTYNGICVGIDGTVYACTGSGKIMRSTDSGATFEQITAPNKTWQQLYTAPNGDIYAIANNNNNGTCYVLYYGTSEFVQIYVQQRFYFGICYDNLGDLYATSTSPNSVMIYTKRGATIDFDCRIIANSFNNVPSLHIEYKYLNFNSFYFQNNAISFVSGPESLRISLLGSNVTDLQNSNNILENPGFIGIEPDPLKIDEDSPCYMAGLSNPFVTEDILGNDYKDPPSIGAYEVVPEITADLIGTPLSGIANLHVQFTDTTLGEPTSWDWDFGDGTPHATEQNPVHVYTRAGSHTVTLIVSVGTTQVSVTKDNYINVEMVAGFTANIDVGPADLVVQFTDTTLGEPTSWDWDFGDGYTSTSQNPTHSYALPGVYTVTLRALSSTSEDQMTKIDYIEVEAPLIADFIGNPLSGNQPLQVQFTDLSTPEGTVTSWEWNFGDSSPFSTLQNPVHSYALPGRYTVTLTVSNGSYENQITKVNYIEVVYVEIAEEEPEPITGGGFTRSGGPTLIFD